MKRLKEDKGITLVALIITIIVLLILAVVAISAVQGDGIIAHAKNARDSYQTAQETENTALAGYLTQIENANGKTVAGSATLRKYNFATEGWDEEAKELTWEDLINGVDKGKYGYNNLYISATEVGGDIHTLTSAFYMCHNLTSITIPNGVTNIGYAAFDYCENLTSITIPNSVKNIEGAAFNMCTSLISITYNGNIYTNLSDFKTDFVNNGGTINDYAFWGCII